MEASVLILLLAVTVGIAEAGTVLFEAKQQPRDSFMCPDQRSNCPLTATCCQLNSGQWGCCPFKQAICCSDKIHCCPGSYSCNDAKQQCVKAINNDTIPWAKKQPSPSMEPPSSSDKFPVAPPNLVCPNGASCPGLSACCRTYAGSYRCCNYPTNVCCADGFHCCPRTNICDAHLFRCLPGFEMVEWTPVASTESSASQDDAE